MTGPLIQVVTDPAMPPGVFELRSGEFRLRSFLGDAAADLLWQRCRTDPEFREDVLSLLESKDWITYSGEAGETIRCESCGTSVALVPERLAAARDDRPKPGIWEPLQWRRHTVRRCDAMRAPFVELEDQQCSFTGGAGERSPDRLDSLVFALHPFLNASFGPPGKPGVRKWAGTVDLEQTAGSEDSMMRRRMRGAHGGLYAGQETPEDAPWDLDGFSPQDDDRPENGRRGNIRTWR